MKHHLQKLYKNLKLTWCRSSLTGFGFAIIIFLPGLDQLMGFSSNFKSTEKHLLAPLPTFHFPHVRTYIHEFNQYYKENFGWRNALFHHYSHLKHGLMGISPLPEKVIVGKKNWFYLGNSYNKVADQHQGLLPITSHRLQAIGRQLTSHQQKLAKLGIKLYVVVAPDSYSIYPENLPAYLSQASVSSNFNYLKRYLAEHTSIPLIDLRPALLAAKSTHVTYCQTDTHWNDYGALIATLVVINHVRQDFPHMQPPILKDYTIVAEKGHGGDLVTMLALNQDIRDSVNYQIGTPVNLRTQQVESIENKGGLPSQRFISLDEKAPTLLFVGDSFSFSMAQFVSGYFSKSYFVRKDLLEYGVVAAEKPNVVILEIVERNLANLNQL